MARSRGQTHWNARFTEDDIRDIRRQVREGVSQREVARRYKVGQGHIWKIVSLEIWTHVE